MRWVIRLLIALLVLHVVAAIVLLVALPRYIDTPIVHQTIAELTAERLGRPLRYERAGVGLLPPSLELIEPVLPGRSEGDPPFLQADEISLRLAILPLLFGRIEVVSLVLDDVDLTAVLDADELWIPGPVEGELPAEEVEAIEEEGALELAIRSVDLRDSTLRLIDRTVDPPLEWTIEDLSVTALGKDVSQPLVVQGSARLGTGGRIALSGHTTLTGDAEIALEIHDWALNVLEAYLGEDVSLDAKLNGEIRLRGPAAAPESLDVRLRLQANRFAFGEAVARGPVDLSASHSGDLATPGGELFVDLTEAELDYPDVARKPAGTLASAKGRFSLSEDGHVRLNISSLRLHNLDAVVALVMADATSVQIDASRFDLAGMGELAPALDGLVLTGEAEIEELDITLEPLRVKGAVVLHDAHVALSGPERVGLRGRISGQGDRILLQGGRLIVGGQQIALTGNVADLAGEMPFELEVSSVGVLRANAMVSAVSELKDVVYGPVSLAGHISGRAGATGSENAFLDLLAGSFRLDMGQSTSDGKEGGRIVGLSVLDQVMGSAGRLGAMTKLTSVLSGGKLPDLGDFTGDEFELIDADFEIGKGLLRTRNLRMLYRSYGVDLNGTVALADEALDMTGEITLGEEILSRFGGQPGGGDVTIPIAHVGGTVSAPEFGVHENAFASLASRVLIQNPVVQETIGKATESAGGVLPPGTEDLLSGGLGGLFGGGKSGSAEKPEPK